MKNIPKDTQIYWPSQKLFFWFSRTKGTNQTNVSQRLQDSKVQCLLVNIIAYTLRTQGYSLHHTH